MNAWDIYSHEFPEAGPHPAVVISSPERTARKPWVSVLLGSSQRASRPPDATEVRLLANTPKSAQWSGWLQVFEFDDVHDGTANEPFDDAVGVWVDAILTG